MVLAFALVAFTLAWFALLTHRPLFDPDEGRYAEIPREMAAGGSWIIPHLDGLAYLEKPPLQYWLTALTFRTLGTSEWTARLWTGLAGYCSLGMVWFLGSRLWGARAGRRALLACIGSSLFVLLGHQLTLDMLLSTGLLACLGCFLMAEREVSRRSPATARRWMIGCWAAMGAAVLCKGLIGVVIPGATLLAYALWQRDCAPFRRLEWVRGGALFAAITAPWFILAARANPAFLSFFFVREHFQRYFTPIEHRSEPWWFFAPVLVVGIMPWLPQALWALALPLRQEPRRPGFDPQRLLWVWCSFVLVFFSLSNAKLIPYILPAVAPLALLCSAPLPPPTTRRLLALGALLSLGACIGTLAYTGGVWNVGGTALGTRISPALRITAGVLGGGVLACLAMLLRNRPDPALTALCAAWFLCSTAILIAADGVADLFSARDAAIALLSRRPAPPPVFSVRIYRQSFPFYLGREVVLVDYHDEFSLGLSQQPDRGIPSLDQFSRRWRALPEAFALMPAGTRDLLLRQGLPMRLVAVFPDAVLMERH